MENIELRFEAIEYVFPLIFVKGTGDQSFLFGTGADQREIDISDFYISRFPVTQILYEHIMGENPANNKGSNIPVECVSFSDIVMADGFFARINAANTWEKIIGLAGTVALRQFRLPSETEWEYAAKGGIHRAHNFLYSGSNHINEVAWYKDNSFDKSMPVGLKKPNQLGIYDMSGNVWEWCQDYYHPDAGKIPNDGSPCVEQSGERVLRGGCFHNWAVHCTAVKRYQITPEFKDPCISFRLVVSA